MDRFERQLRQAEPAFARLLERVPLQANPPLPPAWLRCEMLERHQLLRNAGVQGPSTVLEIGSGPHAISTVPLAFAVTSKGRVIAVERARWRQFAGIVATAGVANRVRPVAGDARHLPLREDSTDCAVCLHGIRSLGDEESLVSVFREMLRVAPRVVVAESLPLATTDAQRAHLAMYELREEVFLTTGGRRDDRRYLPLDRLAYLLERAGGKVRSSSTVQVDLPHALAYFPRTLVESIRDRETRERLLAKWDLADSQIRRYGEDHPPVGLIDAGRA